MNPDQLFISSRNNIPDSRFSASISIPTKVHHLYSSSSPFVNSGVDLSNLTDTNLEVSTCPQVTNNFIFNHAAFKTSDVYASYF